MRINFSGNRLNGPQLGKEGDNDRRSRDRALGGIWRCAPRQRLPAGSATTATTATAAAATTAIGAGFGFVHADATAHPLHILEIIDGLGFLVGAGQIDESKAAFPPGFPIQGQNAFAHFAVLCEEMLKVLSFGIEGEVAYENGHEMNE
jgi:hypothetical protein